MDPDANLKEQIELAEAFREQGEFVPVNDVTRLAELVVAMDNWLRNGGCLPTAWKRK